MGLYNSLELGPEVVFVDEGNAELCKFNEERADTKVLGTRILSERGMEYLGLFF